MKSPDEIKKGLECCHINDEDLCECEECPYSVNGWQTNRCDIELAEDVIALIQQLEAERDAMIEDLKNAHSCFACKKFRRNGGDCCGGSVCLMRDFEWRGVQKEE